MCIDQRGYAYIAQAEAAEFLQPQQLILNQTVNLIKYDNDSVTVHTTGGLKIIADHVLCTFSIGVLQHADITFQPPLPDWKIEAINSFEMVSRRLGSNLGTYGTLGYIHEDLPSIQRDFLVPNRGKHPLGHANTSKIRCTRWDCMLRSKEESIPFGKAWTTLDSSRVLASFLSR